MAGVSWFIYAVESAILRNSGRLSPENLVMITSLMIVIMVATFCGLFSHDEDSDFSDDF